jgi:hypothetical protein
MMSDQTYRSGLSRVALLGGSATSGPHIGNLGSALHKTASGALARPPTIDRVRRTRREITASHGECGDRADAPFKSRLTEFVATFESVLTVFGCIANAPGAIANGAVSDLNNFSAAFSTVTKDYASCHHTHRTKIEQLI